jgi:hypothetical protein
VIGTILIGGIVAGVMLVYNACAAFYLWTWFAVPLGLPALSLAQVAGLILLVAWTQPYRHREDEETWGALRYELLQPGFLLALGWLVKTFWLAH